MDISSFLARRGGVARRSTLLAAGITKADIESALSAGKVLRLRRGIYAVPGGARDIRHAQSCNALLTCVSGAPHYGLWTLNPAAGLHLSAGHKPVPEDSTRHGPCRHPRHPWLPVAGLADVLIHALHCLPELEALVMVQAAISQGNISQGFLAGKLQGNRNGAARGILDLVIPRTDSLLEVLAHTHFVRAGLKVCMHVELNGVGEVDCVVEDCLAVELDGGTHLEPRQAKKDQRRNNATLKGGRLPLRYYYDDVVHHPERMAAEVLGVLELRRSGAFDAR
ncbi:type IV toxin-antitoxin system AbiEi family antitoxin domain-containing protein [Arthrobacter sp. CJ23]|uniref:type IV toxin-antitoxin system AbiEi family antitoxin domain-containing protein n=1 Tax=Arthrobacter sp. CJ23 TaxID=2972479 RepID=UPI00215BDCDF|nr:type IV toxin-antitoxin system AbiEi family antitoxin domain-containing protein [Arthrobacter sp. CJ23]UVJ38706.1 type IV toxin-antitoxin system AbiEi family antitoxin domain-containing protein [Arthrobacter sp. CJ23]